MGNHHAIINATKIPWSNGGKKGECNFKDQVLRMGMSQQRTQYTGEDGITPHCVGQCGQDDLQELSVVFLEHSNSWGGGGDIFRKP